MAFKTKLREHHTVGSFSTPEDLADKLSRDFKKRFETKQQEQNQASTDEEAFSKTAHALAEFRLTPKRYNGHEILLRVSFFNDIFPASRELCRQFNRQKRRPSMPNCSARRKMSGVSTANSLDTVTTRTALMIMGIRTKCMCPLKGK